MNVSEAMLKEAYKKGLAEGASDMQARIVAYLRSAADLRWACRLESSADMLRDFADLIEEGDHLPDGEET